MSPTSKQKLPLIHAAAVVVSFHPEENVFRLLAFLTEKVKKVILVENGSDDPGILEKLSDIQGVEIIANSKNEGIAVALNQGFRSAISNGFSLCFAFDQDSIPESEMLNQLYSFAQSQIQNYKAFALVAGVPRDPNGKILYQGLYPDSANREEPAITRTAITSGSLFDLDTMQKIGFMREDFFIDFVDHEYVFRASDLGYGTFEHPLAVFSHSIGKSSPHRFFIWTAHTSNHSPIRRYYMTRNRIYVLLRFWRTHPSWLFMDFYQYCKELIKMTLFEKGKFQKIRMVILGFWHGCIGKLGPYQS